MRRDCSSGDECTRVQARVECIEREKFKWTSEATVEATRLDPGMHGFYDSFFELRGGERNAWCRVEFHFQGSIVGPFPFAKPLHDARNRKFLVTIEEL